MIKYFFTILFIALFGITVSAQQGKKTLHDLKNKFEAFQYPDVVREADSLLQNDPALSDSTRIDLYRMKGISLYTMNKSGEAKQSFVEILKLNPSFMLDSSNTSPKIISFFNKVKVNIADSLAKQKIESSKIDTLYLTKKIPDVEHEARLRQAVLRSVLLPGLGHLYLGKNNKGWVLTSIGALSLGASIYYAIDSNSKEKKYLDETNPSLIPSLYSKYNTSYKMRNISIITFAAVWLYSQLDLLFFSESSLSPDNFGRHTTLNIDPDGGMQLNLRVNF